MELHSMSTSHQGGWPACIKVHNSDLSLVTSSASSLYAAGSNHHYDHQHHHPHGPQHQQPPLVPPPAGYSWVLARTPGSRRFLVPQEDILTLPPAAYGALTAEGSQIFERPSTSNCFQPERIPREEERKQDKDQKEESAVQDYGRRRNMNDDESPQRTTQQKRKQKEEQSLTGRASKKKKHNGQNPNSNTSMCSYDNDDDDDNDDNGGSPASGPMVPWSKQDTTVRGASIPLSLQHQDALEMLPTRNSAFHAAASPYVVIVEQHYHQYNPVAPVQGVAPSSIHNVAATNRTTASAATTPYPGASTWYSRALAPSAVIMNTFVAPPRHTWGPEQQHGEQFCRLPCPLPRHHQTLSPTRHKQHYLSSDDHPHPSENEEFVFMTSDITHDHHQRQPYRNQFNIPLDEKVLSNIHGQEQNAGSDQHQLGNNEKTSSLIGKSMRYAASFVRTDCSSTTDPVEVSLRSTSLSNESMTCDRTLVGSPSLPCGRMDYAATVSTVGSPPLSQILSPSFCPKPQNTQPLHDTDIIVRDDDNDGEQDHHEKDEGKEQVGGSKRAGSQVHQKHVKDARQGKDLFGASEDEFPTAASAIASALKTTKKKRRNRTGLDSYNNAIKNHDRRGDMRILLEKHERKKEGHIDCRRKEVASPTLASKQGKKKESIIYEVTDDDVLTGVRRGKAYDHPGNREFQKLVREYHDFYIEAQSHVEKAVVANFLLEAVHKRGGRFLQRQDCERNLAEGVSYVELTPDEARQKTRDVLIRLCKGKR